MHRALLLTCGHELPPWPRGASKNRIDTAASCSSKRALAKINYQGTGKIHVKPCNFTVRVIVITILISGSIQQVLQPQDIIQSVKVRRWASLDSSNDLPVRYLIQLISKRSAVVEIRHTGGHSLFSGISTSRSKSCFNRLLVNCLPPVSHHVGESDVSTRTALHPDR